MWQIGALLGLIPTWFWTIVLLAGLGCLVFSWFTRIYKVPLKAAGIICIVIGSWFLGIAANEAKWEQRVKDLEKQLENAKVESQTENVRIEEKIVYKDRIIKQKADTRIEYVDRVIKEKEEVVKYVENCPVPQIILEEHNKAALNQLNEAAKNPNGDKK
jgi:hypothetical protein